MDRLGLFLLEQRRLRGDLIEVFKIMRGMDRVDREQLFPLVEGSVTRGHKLKVRGGRLRGICGLACTAWEGGGGGMPHIL